MGMGDGFLAGEAEPTRQTGKRRDHGQVILVVEGRDAILDATCKH